MLSGIATGTGMRNAGQRVAGCLNHDIDIISWDRCQGIVCKPGGGNPLRGPTDNAGGAPRGVRREVGDHGYLEPRRRWHLSEEHGAKLAGADQTDPDRRTVCRSCQELAVEEYR